MRIKITLRPRSSKIIIPFNHNDYIIGFISQILKSIQNELRYRNDFRLLPLLRKSFRFFTFSRIMIPLRKRIETGFLMKCSKVHFFTSLIFPEQLKESFIEKIKNSRLYLGHPSKYFTIDQIKVIKDPKFSDTMKFKTLSPIKCSIRTRFRHRRIVKYLLPGDKQLKERIREVIIHKYRKLFGRDPKEKAFDFSIDEDYLKSVGGPDRIIRLITVKNWPSKELKIKSFDAHFTLTGNPELIKLAYETGLGEDNRLGFGMIQPVE